MIKEYHIICLKPERLIDYGFEEDTRSYQYKIYNKTTGRVGKEIVVWKNARHRTKYKMTFAWGNPTFTIGLAYLFANLLKDGIIEFEVDTPESKIEKRIIKLENELKELKKRRVNK